MWVPSRCKVRLSIQYKSSPQYNKIYNNKIPYIKSSIPIVLANYYNDLRCKKIYSIENELRDNDGSFNSNNRNLIDLLIKKLYNY